LFDNISGQGAIYN